MNENSWKYKIKRAVRNVASAGLVVAALVTVGGLFATIFTAGAAPIILAGLISGTAFYATVAFTDNDLSSAEYEGRMKKSISLEKNNGKDDSQAIVNALESNDKKIEESKSKLKLTDQAKKFRDDVKELNGPYQDGTERTCLQVFRYEVRNRQPSTSFTGAKAERLREVAKKVGFLD